MKTTRVWIALGIIVLLLFGAVSGVLAQGGDDDGDGLPNDVDRCPNQAGPRANGGCPLDDDGDGLANDRDECPNTPGPTDNNGCPKPDDSVPLSSRDSDGDGVTDDIDYCPSVAGSLDYAGCPQLEEATPTPEPTPDVVMPPLRATGPCTLATATPQPVNVRMLPFVPAPITGLLDPELIYPHYYNFMANDELWYATTDGFVASWATRTGGDCNLTTYSFASETNTLTFKGNFVLPTDAMGFNPQPEPPAERLQEIFPEDMFPFPVASEHILLAHFDMEGMPTAALSAFDPAILEALMEHDEGVVIQLPGNLVGFNPQPEPPANPASFMLPADAVGFNPQPEPPPAAFWLMLMMDAQDDMPVIQTEMMSMSLQGVWTLQTCEAPLGQDACLYIADGSIAACFPYAEGLFCAYSPAMPDGNTQ